jgi:membrane fusion protein, copper/silver efflux system
VIATIVIATMKKAIYLVLILAVAVGSFLAGNLCNRRSGDRNPIIQQPVREVKTPAWESQGDLASMPPGAVRISPEKQQMVGIRVGQVERKPATHTIRLLGRVATDETCIYFINATVDGWITEALTNTTGSFVKKDETLATFYSPEFLSATQALLFALSAKDRVQTTGKETAAQKDQLAQFEINLKQFRDSLRNLGMGNLQIEEMISRRRYVENINITSPADGFILARNISQGLRFEKGRELYRIADLSRVWILADVFEYEAQFFKPGVKARVFLPGQNKTYPATVSKVPPTFDGGTRTLKVRLETDNPGFTLRPDMFVDVELQVNLAAAVTVPGDAILDSGLKKTVFIDLGDGLFEPRAVETAMRIGNRVEITKGLKTGDRIALSGTFLIDSESRLELAAAGMVGTLSKDPVCGVDVSMIKAEKARRKSGYRGRTYYFASDEYKVQFDRHPDRYVENPAGESQPTGLIVAAKALKKEDRGQ